MLQRSVLAVSALVFLGIGLVFLAAPDSLLPRVNITAPPGTALTDIRAVYGGLDLGIGLFLIFCWTKRQYALGLTACAFTLSGLACGRIIGIAIDSNQDNITFILLAAEVIGAVLAIGALIVGGNKTARPGDVGHDE